MLSKIHNAFFQPLYLKLIIAVSMNPVDEIMTFSNEYFSI